MERNQLLNLDLSQIPSPCFLVDSQRLQGNLDILNSVIRATDCKIILALKAFSMYKTFPQISKVLHGTCASSLHEAMLGRKEFGKEVHVYGAAYSDEDFKGILKYADHIDFNSFALLRHFRPQMAKYSKNHKIHFGLRINPEHSEGTVPIYDPCAPHSRLGITRAQFEPSELEGISYLHFHTLCQQNAEPLARTLKVVEEKFGEFIPGMQYVNFGGGHHITREDYNLPLLIDTIKDFKKRYKVQVYLEPGEAVALNAGFLVATVLDVVENGMQIAVLDTSAAAHMPDVIEMPYRPFVLGSAEAGEKPYSYRFAGHSCLAGDIIGDYSFDKPLKRGSKVVFTDMAIYSMVKTNTFNGLTLPSLALMDSGKGTFKVVKKFGYGSFKSRL